LFLTLSNISFATETIEIVNSSSCGLKLIYSNVSQSIIRHFAPKNINSKSSGFISVDLEEGNISDLFVDHYLAHCPARDVSLYIIGHSYKVGWVASMESNLSLKIGGPSMHNEEGDILASQYGYYGKVYVYDNNDLSLGFW
jgi:hypothetical protein